MQTEVMVEEMLKPGAGQDGTGGQSNRWTHGPSQNRSRTCKANSFGGGTGVGEGVGVRVGFGKEWALIRGCALVEEWASV